MGNKDGKFHESEASDKDHQPPSKKKQRVGNSVDGLSNNDDQLAVNDDADENPCSKGSDISSHREKQEVKLETPRSHQTLNDVTDDDDSNNHGVPLGCERVKISSVPFDDYFDDLNDDEYESDYSPENDDELLFRGPAKLHGSRKRNRPEIYHAYVDPKLRTESQCVDLLKEIGCEDNFFACSIEHPNVFFALLNQEEASKLKGVNGIFGAIPRSQIVFDL